MDVTAVRNKNGFTLLEIIFALFIGVVLLGAVAVAMTSGIRSSAALEEKIAAHQDARAVLEVMATEISMVSYNSFFNANLWVNPGTCAPPAANPALRGIQIATANAVTVEMDINDSNALADFPNEIIAYVYNPVTQQITRLVNCDPGGPAVFLGGAAGRVNVVNGALGIPVFTYFDRLGNPTADITQIRRIGITLAVETQDPGADTNTPRRMIYSTSVIPRNHGISP
jgi:prepilin-type N-terminal cleavage/methylation domain-containing protein